jgi:hypothetical protein
MDGARASMDFSDLVKQTLEKQRAEWLAYYRIQRSVIGPSIQTEGALVLDTSRWSQKTFKKAVEWTTSNPTDLARLVWASLKIFLERLGTLFGVRFISHEDTAGRQFIAIYEGNEDLCARARAAAAMGAGRLMQAVPSPDGYLFKWTILINADAELAFFQKPAERDRALNYLGVRTAGMLELLRENGELTNYHRNLLVDHVTKQYRVDREGALNLIEGQALNEKALPEEEQKIYTKCKEERALHADIVGHMESSLARARQAGLELPIEFQRALLVDPIYSKVLRSVARIGRDEYDLTFASELAVAPRAPISTQLPGSEPASDLPFV